MKTTRAILAAVTLAGLAVGCATPTPQELRTAESGREQVETLLDSFAAAVRQKDPSQLRGLLSASPELRKRDAAALQTRLGRASWLEVYSGYSLGTQDALDHIGWKQWREGRLRLEVEGTNAFGEEFENEFELVRADGQWGILDFGMVEPEEGDALDPPQQVREEVMSQAQTVLQRLKEGEAAVVYYELLHEDAVRFRRAKVPWWRRLLRGGPSRIPIYSDLERTKRFLFSYWPGPEEVVFNYAPPNGLVAVYEVPYVWPAAGIEETDILRIELTFLPTDQGWVLYGIRLFGEGIPYS